MRTTEPMRMLVVGTAPGSFGADIASYLRVEAAEELRRGVGRWHVLEAGLPQGEYVPEVELDVLWPMELVIDVMRKHKPFHVVYAAGVNVPDEGEELAANFNVNALVNVQGFLSVAEAFKGVAMPGSHLVGISSNSARIPRSPSVGYCASKAAMSSAIRVLGRRWRGEPLVYGYEPGLMNTETTMRMVDESAWGGKGAHRMRGVANRYGLPAHEVATIVAHNVLWGGMALNGTLQQLDAGEL